MQVEKTTIEVKEASCEKRQKQAIKARSRRPMENVATLVASITPEFKTETLADGTIRETKIREVTRLYVNRECPIPVTMFEN